MHTPHPTQPPRSAPNHKVQKPSKEFRVFQSLNIICSFLLKGKGEGAMANAPPKYASGAMSLVNDQIKQWWKAYCVFAYHQHDEQKLSTVEFRKLYKLGFRQVFVL